MSLDSVYNAKILDYAGNIPRLGRLDAPSGTAKAHSKLCGSTVVVDLLIADGKVRDYAHDVKACALGQAAASIVARNIIGASGEELIEAREAFRAMLKEDGPPPTGRFGELEFLEPVREFKARHASTMLALQAACDAFDAAKDDAPRRDDAPADAASVA